MHLWNDDDVIDGHLTDTLTFTRERFIIHRAQYRDGVFDHDWVSSGTWELSEDGTIIRITEDDHDDDYATPLTVTRSRKSYRWLDDSRDRLIDDTVEWMGTGPRYGRIRARPESSTASPPIGVWTRNIHREEGHVTLAMIINRQRCVRLFYRTQMASVNEPLRSPRRGRWTRTTITSI